MTPQQFNVMAYQLLIKYESFREFGDTRYFNTTEPTHEQIATFKEINERINNFNKQLIEHEKSI